MIKKEPPHVTEGGSKRRIRFLGGTLRESFGHKLFSPCVPESVTSLRNTLLANYKYSLKKKSVKD